MAYLEVQGSYVQLARMQGDSQGTYCNCLQVDRSQSFDIWKTDAHWSARSKDALGTWVRLVRCGAIVGIMLLDLACKLQHT